MGVVLNHLERDEQKQEWKIEKKRINIEKKKQMTAQKNKQSIHDS